MTNTAELEAAFARSGSSKTEIAARLGISRAALFNKINNRSEFKASEINLLATLLNIKNIDEIFFTS